MEAASVGVPVIATDVGGTKEIIKDGNSGLLINPQDVGGLTQEIIRLINNRYDEVNHLKNDTVNVIYPWPG